MRDSAEPIDTTAAAETPSGAPASDEGAGSVISAHLVAAFAVLDADDGTDPADAMGHLRQAMAVVESERAEGRGHEHDPVVASTLGLELTRLCRRDGAPDERWLEAESVLRKAVEWSAPGDSATVRRRLNVFACVHQRLELSPEPGDAADLVSGITEIVESCSDATDPGAHAAAWTSLGHAKRLLSTLRAGDEALALLTEALGDYEQADRVAEESGCVPGAGRADVALIYDHIYRLTGDPALLDDAIRTAVRALETRAPADRHGPNAQMQLAAMLRTRYERSRRERDLRDAVRLSAASVNSWYVERGSDHHQRLERQRIPILTTALLAPGDWADEREELRGLLIKYPLPAGVMAAPDEEMFHPWAAFCAAIGEGPGLGTFAAADEAGAALAALVAATTDAEVRARWRTELAICQLQLVTLRRHVGLGTPDDGPSLQRIALALHADAAEAELAQAVRFRVLAIAAELWFQVAGTSEDQVAAAQRCADTAAVAAATGIEAGVPHGSIVLAMALARRANAHLVRDNPPEVSADAFAREVNAIDAGIDRADALLISDRQRGSLAGETAVCFDDPAEAAWVHLALGSGLDLFDDRTREAEQAATVERSHSAAQVFLNFGSMKARADVCLSGCWSGIELPGLTGDDMIDPVSAAYLAYERASGGASSSVWAEARTALLDRIASLLGPLVNELDGTEAVEVYVSGWARTVPIIPLLSAALAHGPTVVEVLGTRTAPATATAERFGAIAAPGDPAEPLASAIDDAEEAHALFGSLPEDLIVDPMAEDFLSVARRCTIVLFAGHALASRRDPGDSAILLRSSAVSAADLLSEDLSHVELAVLAACETMAPDGQIPERPLSLATAMLFAGADAVAGSHWRVTDAHASAFAIALLRARRAGGTVAASYRAALRETGVAGLGFTLAVNRRIMALPDSEPPPSPGT